MKSATGQESFSATSNSPIIIFDSVFSPNTTITHWKTVLWSINISLEITLPTASQTKQV